MRAALARVLVIIASLIPWFGNVYMFIMPVAGVIFGKDSDTPLLTYSYIFFGMWAAYWALHLLVWLVVMTLQFVFFGTTARSELIIESRLDQPQVQELLNSGEFTRQSLGEQYALELKEDNKALSRIGYLSIWSALWWCSFLYGRLHTCWTYAPMTMYLTIVKKSGRLVWYDPLSVV